MPTNKHRLSVNLTEAEYDELSRLALESRLSMAWLAREALIEHLRRQPNSTELQLIQAAR
jgi:hypothetical protein